MDRQAESTTLPPPCGFASRLSTSSDSNSPEFEFWRLRNPNSLFPPPTLLSADELFSDGFLLPLPLPLHLLSPQPVPDLDSRPGPELPTSESDPGPELTSKSSAVTLSKRWRDIFRKREKKNEVEKPKEEKKKQKMKQREKKSLTGSGSAELNINIWPFSRSRSAGNSVTRPRMSFGAPSTRKSSSAPCSRSNSAGESKSRKWPTSPGRSGVHLGRSSPVWQVRRRGSGGKGSEPMVRSKTEDKAKAGLYLNAPMCIGYRTRLSCRNHENGVVGGVGRSGSTSGSGGGNGNFVRGTSNFGNSGNNLFGLRSLFAKKAY